MKLEKTKISTMLHEFKIRRLAKGTPEYKYITKKVTDIDNTKMAQKEQIIEIYHNILETYVDNGKGVNDISLVGRGLGDIIKLIGSKVENNYCNDIITEWDEKGIL